MSWLDFRCGLELAAPAVLDSAQSHRPPTSTELTIQASISVILVLLYGYLARAYSLLSEEGERVSVHFPFFLEGRRLLSAHATGWSANTLNATEHFQDLGHPVSTGTALLGNRSFGQLGEPEAVYV